ncbi:hypothetical protein GCM10009865_52420 [Aeromicrobium ponti]
MTSSRRRLELDNKKPELSPQKKVKAEFRFLHIAKSIFCLHSQIIYGDPVETFEPYYRGYMKVA